MLVVITNDGELDGVARANSPMRVERSQRDRFQCHIDFGDDVACFRYGFFGGATGGDGVYIASSEKIGALGKRGVRRLRATSGVRLYIVGTEIGLQLAGGNGDFEHALTLEMGMAKPIPSASELVAVLMPMTSPAALTSVRPELPALIAASV